MQYTMTKSGMGMSQARASKYTPRKAANSTYSKYRNLNMPYGGTATPTGFDAINAKVNNPKPAKRQVYDVGAEYQKALDEANAKNDARDQEIRAGYQEREDKANALIDSQGVLAKKDLEEAYRQQGAAQNARLTGLGLGNTSVVGAMQQGLLRRRGDAMTGLNESLDRNRLNVQSQMAGDRLAYWERPNDIAPDLNQMIAVAQLQGKMGGGYNTGGYSGGSGGAFGAAAPVFGGTFGMGGMTPYSGGGTYGGAARSATSQMNRTMANMNRKANQPVYGNYNWNVPQYSLPTGNTPYNPQTLPAGKVPTNYWA